VCRTARCKCAAHVCSAPFDRQRELHGRVVAVVDDVVTSGATVAEISRVLLRAGAAQVHVWMLARTPRPQDR